MSCGFAVCCSCSPAIVIHRDAITNGLFAVAADAVAKGTAPETIRVPALEARVFAVVAGPEERSGSVVSVLDSLRETYDIDPEVGAVRRALRSLERKHVVEVVYRTVPTFRLAVERDAVDVEIAE